MMGERTVAQEALFYELNLERHVPANHLAFPSGAPSTRPYFSCAMGLCIHCSKGDLARQRHEDRDRWQKRTE